MSAASLNGYRVTSCHVHLPAWGVWFADVTVERTELLTGSVTLVVEDLTLVGTILSGGAVEARTRYRIAGGAGGWGRTIASKAEANDLGVKYSTILNSAASLCGETLGPIPAGTAGPSFVRTEGPAARVLDELFPHGWYVDEAGVTQIGRRAATTYALAAPRVSKDLARGMIELAPTAIATLLPGAVVDGVEAVDVEHDLDAGKLRTTILGRGIADSTRLSTAFERIVHAFTAHHKYFATWEYRVVQRSGERLDLQCVRVSSGMPDLRSVRVRPGAAGYKARPKLGSLVLVSFVNGDPARPVVVGFDDPETAANGFIADDVFLQAGTTGTQPTEHATSAQSLLVALKSLLPAIGGALGAPGAAVTALAVDATFAGLVTTMAAGTLGPLTKAALLAALAAKTADTAGDTPSLGWPHVRGG